MSVCLFRSVLFIARPALVPTLLLAMPSVPLGAASGVQAVVVDVPGIAMNEPHWVPPVLIRADLVGLQTEGDLILEQVGDPGSPPAPGKFPPLYTWFLSREEGTVNMAVAPLDINQDGIPDGVAHGQLQVVYHECVPIRWADNPPAPAGGTGGQGGAPGGKLMTHFRYATYRWVSSHQ
ncbi:MAG: hypothetical protein ABSH53_01485 [Holophaga sp.]